MILWSKMFLSKDHTYEKQQKWHKVLFDGIYLCKRSGRGGEVLVLDCIAEDIASCRSEKQLQMQVH